MSNSFLISVIMLVYNAEEYLRYWVESAVRLLDADDLYLPNRFTKAA
jgi:hypothetical protein